MIKPVLIAFIVLLACVINLKGEAAETESAIYDSNPTHLWNQLNETLFSRTAPDGKKFGLDELDILYWFRTTNLLFAPSHEKAIAVLDEFTNTHGENLIRAPLKRALLQHDLWELFDWSARHFRGSAEANASEALQSRMVTLIRRLALTTNEIAALPDNYAQTEAKGLPDFPAGLLQTNGAWLNVGISGYNAVPITPTHLSDFKGHSSFNVLVRVPGGRMAAISYLNKLRSASTNFPKASLQLNSGIPQFPTNTEWALIRRMCVIDAQGQMQPTPITESIQVRRYRNVEKGISDSRLLESTNVVQEFFQFDLDRRQHDALRAVSKEERGFPFVHFRSKGIDAFEEAYQSPATVEPPDSAKLQTKVLGTCFQCHSAPGVFSVNSYTGFFSSELWRRPADLAPVEFSREAKAAIYWKQQQFDWGLLQGLWRNAEKP